MRRMSHRSRFVSLILLSTAASGCDRAALAEAQASPITQAAREIIRVPSRDGTLIALECEGSGPTLILVHGGVGDRTRWTPMLPLLSSRFTACAMDRRGRGGSGDSPEYSLMKEAEDVAAVVDSRAGEVFVLGHSYGGVSALEATLLTRRIGKLILYEPPLQDPVEHNLAVADKIEHLIQAGQREDAVVTFQREVGQQSPSEIAAMKSRPSWPALVATIHSHPRQMRALAGYRFDPQRIKSVAIPTLLLIGGENANPHIEKAISSLQASLPKATLAVLAGQQHNAMDGARELLAEKIMIFLLGVE
jgi:pimeloyl-ACP methyl ester carboxylesterase